MISIPLDLGKHDTCRIWVGAFEGWYKMLEWQVVKYVRPKVVRG